MKYLIKPSNVDYDKSIYKNMMSYHYQKLAIISFRRSAYFSYHLSRCKKTEDVARLIFLLIYEMCIAVIYLVVSKDIARDALDLVTPKLRG